MNKFKKWYFGKTVEDKNRALFALPLIALYLLFIIFIALSCL